MSSPTSNLRGIALMVLATGVFSINDAMLKLAASELPPLQSLFMRGIGASVWCLLLVLATGGGRLIGQAFAPITALRSIFELLAVLSFIFALANMPIADITAIGQTAPLLLLAGVALIYREKLGWVRWGLMALGLAGALLVAQPTGSANMLYAGLGFVSAISVALRDIVGRKVPGHLPGPVVAFSTVVIVTLGAGLATLGFETWQAPTVHQWALTAGAGLFLTVGHLFIFLAYRAGSTGSVAPFYYSFTLWAVISGIVVFGTVPNQLATAGIIVIIASGVAVAVLDERRRRLSVLA